MCEIIAHGFQLTVVEYRKGNNSLGDYYSGLKALWEDFVIVNRLQSIIMEAKGSSLKGGVPLKFFRYHPKYEVVLSSILAQQILPTLKIVLFTTRRGLSVLRMGD